MQAGIAIVHEYQKCVFASVRATLFLDVFCLGGGVGQQIGMVNTDYNRQVPWLLENLVELLQFHKHECRAAARGPRCFCRMVFWLLG